MTFSIETIYRFEGIANSAKYGFASLTAARLRNGTTALSLLQSYLADELFSPYSERRENLLNYVFSA